LPGILNWALEGLAGLHERGRFTEPASSRDAVVTLADLVSPTSAFVRDRCEVGPASEVPCDQLYAAWKAWAEDNGHRAGSSSTFGRDLRAVLPGLRSIRPRTDDRQRLYRGVRLATNHTAPVHGPAWTGPPVEPVVQDGPADRPFRSEGTEPFAASADPSLEPALGADLDDWLAAPSGDQLSLADDWGTIG
jgi:putative DNA primase/helicase